MTIEKAMELLLRLKEMHGNVEVFFDCQHCNKSTKPDIIVAVAMVLSKL